MRDDGVATVRPEQLFTGVHPSGALGRIAQFPLVRILWFALFLAPFLLIHNTVIADFIIAAPEPYSSWYSDIDAVVSIVIILGLYVLYVRWVERRGAHEIGKKGAFREFAVGFLVSFALVGFMVGLMALLGFYRIVEFGPPRLILDALCARSVGALIQVLAFRLILFRLAEETVGTWLAYIAVALVFSFAHLANENATVWTSGALLVSDVILAAAFIYTRRLWMAWGIHAGWNFFQDGVFGLPNSGITSLVSWITPKVSGPEWLTGGDFGIEASYVALLLSVTVGLLILWRAIVKGQIVRPAWKRRSAHLG